MTAMLEAPLRLDVNKNRLLSEFANFFQSQSEALTEIVQNAYRAGATQIRFLSDIRTGEIIIRDNGPGASDPRALITAGTTGWDETKVVEPAGLGFFALLGICEEVFVESSYAGGAWSMTITEDAFLGADIEHHEITVPMESTYLLIRAKLKPNFRALRPSDDFRHFFPLTVEWTHVDIDGNVETKVIDPLEIGDRALVTPVGTLRRRANGRRYYSEGTLVWEHRELSNTDFLPAVREAIRKMPKGDLVCSRLDAGHFTLELDPNTGVRPKLPDRREVIDNPAYRAVIAEVAKALYEAYNLPGFVARRAELDLPAVLSMDEVRPRWDDSRNQRVVVADWAEGVAHPVFGHISNEDFLLSAGYTETSYEDLKDIHYEVDDETLYPRIGDERVYALAPMEVDDGAMASALTRAGIPAVYRENGRTLWARLTNGGYVSDNGLAYASEIEVLDESGVVVARPDELILLNTGSLIEVNGVVITEADDNFDHCLYAVKGSAGEVLEHIRQESAVDGYYIYLVHNVWDCLYDYYEDADDCEVDTARMTREMIDAYTKALMPDHAHAEQRFSALTSLDDGLSDVVSSLRWKVLSPLTEAMEKFPELEQLKRLKELVEELQGYDLDLDRWNPVKTPQ